MHENRGLNPHIEDIARRLALDNFVAFAPDALLPLGGYPGDEDKARELFPKLDQAKTREDFVAAAELAESASRMHRQDRRRRLLLRRRHRQHAGDAHAGSGRGRAVLRQRSRPREDVPKIKAPLLIHYAGERRADQRGLAGLRGSAEGAQGALRGFIYAGAQHGFNNDTTPRYDEASAKLAWKRTVDFFNKNLRG